MTTDSDSRRAAALIGKAYRMLLAALCIPVILGEYFDAETGAQYDVGPVAKLLLAAEMIRNNRRIPTGSTFLEHLVIATKVLRIPADVDGRIVECGCFKGGSTANLSLVTGLCGRELDVFDSFEGMPEPSDRDRTHTLIESNQVHTYAEGSWRASLEEVRRNVERYGDDGVCSFHVGFFEETMPSFDEPCAAIFLDVGLRDSAETCLRHLWPLLEDGCYLFTHDVKHMEIATLYFDAGWWAEALDDVPPGLIGAGSGLGLHPGSNGFSSLLGYTVKNPEPLAFEEVQESGESNTVNIGFR